MFRIRPRLRFSLRTLFVLVTLLCITLGWLGYQYHWVQQRREALASRQVFDFTDSASLPAPGILWIFGERGYPSLIVLPDYLHLQSSEGPETLEADLKRAQELFPEAKVSTLR